MAGSRKKPSKKQDPFLKREQSKYENPIPSREFILDLLAEKAEPLSFETLRLLLEIEKDSMECEALKRRLTAMVRDGQIIRNRRSGYALIDKMDLFKGRVVSRRDGDGILIDDDKQEWVLSHREMRKVFHGDVVVARAHGEDRKGRKEAKIIEVVDHKITQVVGRFHKKQSIAYVVPEDKKITEAIQIPDEDCANAEPGQIVVVEICTRPSYQSPAIGKVIEVLGEHMAPGMEIDIAVRQHDVPYEWPKAVRQEASQIEFDIPEREYQHRVDLRELPLVTIDGEDARDFDDAVYCEPKKSGGWRLWVAIADVSFYVRPNTALDEEAQNRATSVYFPGQVIPMLPEVLANGVCSLKPKVERRCMVCEMTISARGKLSGYQFYPAVMRSWARLTYNQVAKALESEDCDEIVLPLVPHLRELHALYLTLREKRIARGALEFESQEPLFIFSDEKKIARIELRERNDAHKIIEECMILANICAAKFLDKAGVHALVRNHEGPSDKKLLSLQQFLAEKGIRISAKKTPSPKDFAAILASVEHRLDKEQIQTMLLRSMNQAVYHPEQIGHFGLALEEYTHFTSPIRRYPDLVVHRAIKQQLATLNNKRAGYEGRKQYKLDELTRLGEHTSFAERRAEEASRDVNDWLKCEFMLDKVGMSYSGTVSGVTHFGLFVRLDDFFIEGLIHVTHLVNDYYHFDAQKMILVGEKSRLRFGIGDRVDVLVARVDLDSRQIDFELKGLGPKTKPAKSKSHGRRQKNAMQEQAQKKQKKKPKPKAKAKDKQKDKRKNRKKRRNK